MKTEGKRRDFHAMFARHVAIPGAGAMRAARVGRPPRKSGGPLATALARALAAEGFAQAAETAGRKGNRLTVTELVSLAGEAAPEILAQAMRTCRTDLARAGSSGIESHEIQERMDS